MKREIIITGGDESEELSMAFVIDGEKVAFKSLTDEEIDEFAAMIFAFSDYFSNIASTAGLEVFNAN